MRSDRQIPSTESVTSLSTVVTDAHALARHHRAMIIGEMLADGILWLWRLPERLIARLRPPRAAH